MAAPPLSIPDLSAGERVLGELLVYDRAEKRTNDGKPFVVLTLGNNTGKIETAPIWSERLEWAEGASQGKIVQAIGDVTHWSRGGAAKKQLTLSGPVRVLPDTLFLPERFLPSIDGDRTRLWDFVDKLRAEMTSEPLREVLDLFFGDDAFRVRFEQLPASTGGHHAKLGGLLLHVCEVARMAREMARTMKCNVDLVVSGALLHDVGKVDSYEIGPGGFAHTPCGLLLGHIVLGCLMLERRVTKASSFAGRAPCGEGQLLELQHMILSHHGSLEYGSPVQPMTTEAEIVHWADEASAKATDMMESLADPELFAGGREVSDKRNWRLGRYIWRRPHEW